MRLFLVLIYLFSASVLADIPSNTQDGEIAIVAGAGIRELSSQEIRRIFTLRQRLLSNNCPIKLVALPLTDSITKKFTRRVFDLYPYQLKRQWDRQIYSGRASSPEIVTSESDIIQFISHNLTALGYISTKSTCLTKHQGEIHVIAIY